MNQTSTSTPGPSRLSAGLFCAMALLYSLGAPSALAEDRREHSSALDKADSEELQWQVPAAPLPENLLPFYTSITTGHSFAIDGKSLTVDKDGVVRYTMVATSSGGAKNVSYEGIRCATMEKKLFAFGHADGTWANARDPQWEPIPTLGANLPQLNLAKDYVCKSSLIPGKTGEILNDLRYHRAQSSSQM
jgi:hypothetical protein